MRQRLRRRWRWIGLGGIVLLIVGIGGFILWASKPYGEVMYEARAALRSSDAVAVQTDRWLVFRPVEDKPTTGFIFYPGGRVLAEAYAPAAQAITEAGYLVVIVPMPLNLAVFGANQAADVLAAFPDIKHWAIGGHSLGGVMAARFVYDNPGAIQGLVFWAAYPETSSDLSDRNSLVVASIYGTADKVAKLAEIENSRAYLPADTQFVAIEGGNHAQFGWYGAQPGDGEATISREDQQAQIVEATLMVLTQIEAPY